MAVSINATTVENGRGSWTRTNGCQDQNLMPYQLGYTPVMCKRTFNSKQYP